MKIGISFNPFGNTYARYGDSVFIPVGFNVVLDETAEILYSQILNIFYK